MIKNKSIFLYLTVLILLTFSVSIGIGIRGSFSVSATTVEANPTLRNATVAKTSALIYTSAQSKVIPSKITQAAAVKIALSSIKKYFNFEFDAKKYQTNIQLTTNEPSSNIPIWAMSWYGYFNSINYNITCYLDANSGKILKLGKTEDSGENKPIAAKYSEAKAKKNAEVFIEKINPGALKASKQVFQVLDYNSYGGKPVYTFTYSRLIKNIPFDENTITAICDGASGKVTNYSYDWVDSLSIPSSVPKIKHQTAVETLKKELILKPQYISYRDNKHPEKPTTVKVVYVPTFENGRAVDAVSGNLTSFWQYMKNMKKIDLNDKDKVDFLSKYKENAKLTQDMDKAKANEIMNKLLQGILDDNVTLDTENSSFQDNSKNTGGSTVSVWNGQFTGKADATLSGSISIAAPTGELVALYLNNRAAGQESFTPKLTWNEAYTKAINLLVKDFPSKLKELDTSQTYYNGKIYSNGKEIPPQQYFFIFQRRINNLNYLDNSVQISISPKTGELSSMNCNWDKNLVFPKPSNSFNSEKAKKLYLDQFKPVLSYITYDKSADLGKSNKIVKLAYLFKWGNYSTNNTQVYIEDSTGRFLNSEGEAITKK